MASRRNMRPTSEPYDFGRWPDCGGEFVEIGVGAHNHEAFDLGKLPDVTIGPFEQIERGNVSRVRVQLCQTKDEFAREILVEEQLHSATRLPSLAANS